ncbi:MAG TPA: hypothetical protein VJN94_15715 [Candidatus Binataceae bacterium]|nr:hypothetical protein [Candidatus Binataceae bacterium]
MHRPLLVALAFLIGSLAAAPPTSAKGPPPLSPSGYIKGVYNCQLSGGFVAQPDSTALMQFAANGKGGVNAGPGELHVVVGQVLFVSDPTAGDTVFLGKTSSQSCNYTILTGAPGGYSLTQSGSGALEVGWTPIANNSSTPIDCSEQITTHYDILVTSPSSFMLMSSDPFLQTQCNGTSGINYANCGSTFTGICQQQAPKP